MKSRMSKIKRIIATLLSTMILVGALKLSVIADAEEAENGEMVVFSRSTSTPLTINCTEIDIEGYLVSNCGVEGYGISEENIVLSDEKSLYDAYNFLDTMFEKSTGFRFLYGDGRIQGYKINESVFCENEVELSAYSVMLGEVLGANGDVNLSAARISSAGTSETVKIISSNEDVNIDASDVFLNGIIYAPNGSVHINANNVYIEGVIVADEVVINANTVELVSDCELLNNYNICMYNLADGEIFSGNLLECYGSSSSSSGSNKYYYNTGTTVKTSATYDEYNLLSVVKAGDIVYEANGGFGITGHIAYVEGIYCMPEPGNYTNPKMYYNIRIIEAISEGVCYGILDDTRCDDKDVTILRYSSLTKNMRTKITYFIKQQIGKPYNLDLGQKDTSIDEEDWYCSELVWAGYKYIGIDIEKSGISEPGVTPRDIKNSGCLVTVSYK